MSTKILATVTTNFYTRDWTS